MRITSYLIVIGILLPILLEGQGVGQENIVPNPGFERYSGVPLGWFYTGKDFTRVSKFWESPTIASPDLYGPKVHVPTQWQNKGFGEIKPHDGASMVGITVFGCEGGKPHCREYIQIQLTEPLVIGQRYLVEFWSNHLPRSICINSLGACFSENRIYELTDRELDLSPLLQTHDIIECKKGEWLRFSTEFIAEEPGSYLIIGNFYSDEKTEHRKVSENSLPFAYYYLDDIHVKKLEPILDVPISEDDLSLAPLDVGRTIELKNIYFDHDKADFLPRSFKELNTLVKIMKENPNMVIKIMGHTDNSGTDDYNQNLSNERAGAVVQYLRSNGITSDRMSHIGFGSKKPIASNISERGRQQNRRVEFLILRK